MTDQEIYKDVTPLDIAKSEQRIHEMERHVELLRHFKGNERLIKQAKSFIKGFIAQHLRMCRAIDAQVPAEWIRDYPETTRNTQ